MRVLLAVSIILYLSLISCSAQSQSDRNAAQLSEILKVRYNNDDRKVKVMFKKLTSMDSAKNDLARRTFSDEQLMKFVDKYISGYEKWYLPYRQLWDDFKQKSIEWYPHLGKSDFIEDFTEKFLWHSKIFEYNIKQFTATKQGMEQLLPYVNNYANKATENKEKVFEAIMMHIRDILETDFNMKGQELETFFKQQQTKYRTLGYDAKYLFQRDSLKTAITPNAFEKCVLFINAEKQEYLRADNATTLDTMREHFASDDCVAREICSQNSLTGINSLAHQLEPYIAWLRTVSEGNELEENANMKDEIDVTVFHLIEMILKKQNVHSELRITCMIEYMKRTQSVDKVYTTLLLIDDEKLSERIGPMVKEYGNLYPEVL